MDRIERDTCSVALLFHATKPVVLHDHFFRHIILRRQLHQKMAAIAATDTGWKIVESGRHQWPANLHELPSAAITDSRTA
jgi:hypothetical protein